MLRIWPEHRNLVGVASFNVPGYRPDLVAAYLSAEHGIGVRGGKFCAHPLLADGPRWNYASVDGYLSPNPDPRPPIDELISAAIR